MQSKEEIEKDIKTLKSISESITYSMWSEDTEALRRVLKYIENSIPKEKVEEYLKQEQEAFNTYKKESKENENLKMGMYKHLGAKNICERILGIERNIATLD